MLFELTPVMQQEDLGLFPTSTVATTRNDSTVNSGPAGRNLITVVKGVAAHCNLFNIEKQNLSRGGHFALSTISVLSIPTLKLFVY